MEGAGGLTVMASTTEYLCRKLRREDIRRRTLYNACQTTTMMLSSISQADVDTVLSTRSSSCWMDCGALRYSLISSKSRLLLTIPRVIADTTTSMTAKT